MMLLSMQMGLNRMHAMNELEYQTYRSSADIRYVLTEEVAPCMLHPGPALRQLMGKHKNLIVRNKCFGLRPFPPMAYSPDESAADFDPTAVLATTLPVQFRTLFPVQFTLD